MPAVRHQLRLSADFHWDRLNSRTFSRFYGKNAEYLCGCVSGLLVAVVPLGERGHWGTWASAAAGCGLSARSGQDLEHGFRRRGLWASWLCSTWDRPGPGMKPVFPAWARDGFLRSRRGSPRPKLEMDILPSPAWDGRVSERSGPEKGLHREGLTFVSHRPALLLLLEVS